MKRQKIKACGVVALVLAFASVVHAKELCETPEEVELVNLTTIRGDEPDGTIVRLKSRASMGAEWSTKDCVFEGTLQSKMRVHQGFWDRRVSEQFGNTERYIQVKEMRCGREVQHVQPYSLQIPLGRPAWMANTQSGAVFRVKVSN